MALSFAFFSPSSLPSLGFCLALSFASSSPSHPYQWNSEGLKQAISGSPTALLSIRQKSTALRFTLLPLTCLLPPLRLVCLIYSCDRFRAAIAAWASYAPHQGSGAVVEIWSGFGNSRTSNGWLRKGVWKQKITCLFLFFLPFSPGAEL